METERKAPLSLIETLLRETIPAIVPADPTGRRGRPSVVSGAMLWAGVLTSILDGEESQRAIWRTFTTHGLWDWPRIDTLSDDAIYRRLQRSGPAPMQAIWQAVTDRLAGPEPASRTTLAPIASTIVALDETTLDQVRQQGDLRQVTAGNDARMPGKISALFDLRNQRFRTIRLHDNFRENERVPALEMLADLPPRSLILTDLGYFGFPFFDTLTDREYLWVARMRQKTSFTVAHTLWERDGHGEWLVWLGKYRADRAAHLVRLVVIQRPTGTFRYLTNVLEPERLPMQDVVDLYARRWDIELAFKTLKKDLGLRVIWSTHWSVVQIQIWAVLTIAQVAFHLRLLVAEAAQVDLFDVSLALLLKALPTFLRHGENPLDVIPTLTTTGGLIRPSRRIKYVCPEPGPITPIPEELPRVRAARYAGRRCGPQGTDRRPHLD